MTRLPSMLLSLAACALTTSALAITPRQDRQCVAMASVYAWENTDTEFSVHLWITNAENHYVPLYDESGNSEGNEFNEPNMKLGTELGLGGLGPPIRLTLLESGSWVGVDWTWNGMDFTWADGTVPAGTSPTGAEPEEGVYGAKYWAFDC